MTRCIIFTINNINIQPNSEILRKEELLISYAKLRNEDIRYLLLSTNSEIINDLIFILRKGYLIVEDYGSIGEAINVDYPLLEKIMSILGLADKLKIDSMNIGSKLYYKPKSLKKYQMLSYMSCFKLLEIRYDIQILAKRTRGSSKYNFLLTSDTVIETLKKNNVEIILDYFENPQLKDFINLIVKSYDSDKTNEFGYYFIDIVSYVIDIKYKCHNIKQYSSILIDIYTKKLHKESLLIQLRDMIKFLIYGDDMSYDIGIILILVLSLKLNGLITFHVKHKIIKSLETRMIGYPISGDMIYDTLIKNTFECSTKKTALFNCIALKHFDLFIALILYCHKTLTIFWDLIDINFTVVKDSRLCVCCENIGDNYDLHRDLYRIYPYDTSNFLFSSLERKITYNEIIGQSGRFTKSAIKCATKSF